MKTRNVVALFASIVLTSTACSGLEDIEDSEQSADNTSDVECLEGQCMLGETNFLIQCIDAGTVIDFQSKFSFSYRNSQICQADGSLTYIELDVDDSISSKNYLCETNEGPSVGELFVDTDPEENLICSNRGVHVATHCPISDEFDGVYCPRAGCKFPKGAVQDGNTCLPNGTWSN